MSAFTFKDRIVLHNNQPLATLDSTGVSRSNLLLVNNGVTNLTGIQSNPIYINNNVTSSTLIINNTVGNNVIVRSKLGVGSINTSSTLGGSITLQNGGYISNDSSFGNTNSFIGISGGYQLDSTSGSRITLYGNTASGSAGNLELYTGNDSNSSFGVYTGQDSLKLKILNVGTSLFTPDGSTIVLAVGSTTSSFNNELLLSNTSQSTGVGTGGSLTVKGGASINKDLYVGGTITSSSDSRLKENITELDGDYLRLIDQIRTVKYNLIGQDSPQYGFIAQDFEKSFPELIKRPDENGYYSLDYQKMTVILLKCIKELKSKIILITNNK